MQFNNCRKIKQYNINIVLGIYKIVLNSYMFNDWLNHYILVVFPICKSDANKYVIMINLFICYGL